MTWHANKTHFKAASYQTFLLSMILFQTCDTLFVSLMVTPSVQPISSTPRPPDTGQFWSSMREARLPVQDCRPDKDHRWPSELIRIRTERFFKDQTGWRVLIGPHLLMVPAALWLVSLVWRQLWFNIWESISDPAQKQIQVQCFNPENLIGLFREITLNQYISFCSRSPTQSWAAPFYIINN